MTTDKQIEIYQSADGETEVEVCLADETVWLNRQQLGELDKEATVAKFATVQIEGGRPVERQVEHYNLDVIISVGYRVKSLQGTLFRI